MQVESICSLEKKMQFDELLRIADRTITLDRNKFLFREGQKAYEFFIVLSGKLLISKLNNDGSELFLRICATNDICGELILFVDNPTYFFNAKALVPVEVAAIRKDVFEEGIINNPKLSMEYIIWSNGHLRNTMTKFRDLILPGKKGSLYSTLIRLANSFGIIQADGSTLINHPLTNNELAAFCASSRETVNIMLNDLKKRGVISIKKSKITIHQLGQIKKEIGCENCSSVCCSIE